MPNETVRVWTIRDVMKSTIALLQQKGVEEARLNVELLLAHALGLQRIQLYLNFEKPISVQEQARFQTLIERRLNHEPVQYIIGSTNFMGLHFIVNSQVLIPRPETETLIEEVMMIGREYPKDTTIQILDIGTGSGNIAISLAKFISHSFITAIDTSKEALSIAHHNARIHDVESRMKLLLVDIFHPNEILDKEKYDFVVSNPPYISKDDWEHLHPDIRDFEPSIALTDGKSGLAFYNHIIKLIPDLLKPGGMIFLEVGYGQVNSIVTELKRIGINRISIANDMQSIPRVVSGVWLESPLSTFQRN